MHHVAVFAVGHGHRERLAVEVAHGDETQVASAKAQSVPLILIVGYSSPGHGVGKLEANKEPLEHE